MFCKLFSGAHSPTFFPRLSCLLHAEQGHVLCVANVLAVGLVTLSLSQPSSRGASGVQACHTVCLFLPDVHVHVCLVRRMCVLQSPVTLGCVCVCVCFVRAWALSIPEDGTSRDLDFTFQREKQNSVDGLKNVSSVCVCVSVGAEGLQIPPDGCHDFPVTRKKIWTG